MRWLLDMLTWWRPGYQPMPRYDPLAVSDCSDAVKRPVCRENKFRPCLCQRLEGGQRWCDENRHRIGDPCPDCGAPIKEHNAAYGKICSKECGWPHK